MTNLKSIIAILLLSVFFTTNVFGQVSFEDLKNPPRTNAEVTRYIDKYLSPQINDTLIAQLFEEADVVFEGELIESEKIGGIEKQRIYHFEPYKIFKGTIQKDSIIKILANGKPQNATYDLGEWSHGRLEVGVFFVKKDPQNSNLYRFVNPKNAWVVYPKVLIGHPLMHDNIFRKMFYEKLLEPQGAKYEKTAFYHKKKEKLSVGNAAARSSEGVITGFSRDTVPAGVLSGASRMTIYGSGLGTVQGNVLMEDANQNKDFIALHPTQNILHWSNDSIQIVVPSIGFVSATDPDIGDTRSACAGTGISELYPVPGCPFPFGPKQNW